ncbi:hypothetical protein AQ490_02100 [Wenjunlia vitaminophila]|uniref:Anti-sigma factor antagonist n=1 Tax=Wenjunlia vitaminophila TaxID=76728 RepID=A0A0T6LY33_WENVI|nr:STAS domain-containing protein [Wenjunlia vitaminophila]KRV51022.1 hypothetical protein AQ490_02100 [Wenjunlia vitaminophila]
MYHDELTFSVRERRVGDTIVVELRGELDLFATPRLSARLDALTVQPRPALVLDLRQLAFMDCGALTALCRVRARTAARGGRLYVVTNRRHILRLLQVTRLLRAFDVFSDLPSALARAASASDTPTQADQGAIA